MIMLMEQIIMCVGLGAIGLCFGSFAGASVWRIRAEELKQYKEEGEEIDVAEYDRLKKITNKKIINDHSRCLDCGYRLKWYDMIPLISWLSLSGRCRKCRKMIGRMEPLIELGVALFFIVSYVFWPYPLIGIEIVRFGIWLVAGIALAVLFAYDAKWFLLPDKINYFVVFIGIVNALIIIFISRNPVDSSASIAGSVFVLSGIYWIIYKVSDGKWIGYGDIKLCLGLALLLADWKLAFLALFLANLIGCVAVLPAMLAGKLKRSSHIPFGPFLISGAVLVCLFGDNLIEIFFSSLV